MKYEYLKGSEKDFEVAPEWAELIYFGDVKCFVGRDGRWKNESSSIIFNDFAACFIPARLELIAERRPITEPEWDGVGIPPVGCEFEYQDHNGKFIRATMDYCGKNFAIVHYSDSGDSWLRLAGAKFRPLRTEADKKRDHAVGTMERCWELVTDKPAYQFEVIYDAIAAGKIPGVKLGG